MASEGTSYDYDPDCERCDDGYHHPPHERRVPLIPALAEDGVKMLIVRPPDVLVIYGLNWDASVMTDAESSRLKQCLGVSEIVMLSGPAEFAIVRKEEQ